MLTRVQTLEIAFPNTATLYRFIFLKFLLHKNDFSFVLNTKVNLKLGSKHRQI